MFDSLDNTYVCVHFNGAAGGTHYFDNVSIAKYVEPEEPDEPSFDGFVTNGDFETGDLTGWNTADGAVVSDAIAHGGKYAASSNKTSVKYETMLRQEGIAVEKNGSYAVTFWYYYDGTNAKPEFYLYAMNGETSLNRVTYTVAAAKTWTQAILEFTATDCEEINLVFQNRTADDGGTYYFDDITMKKAVPPSFDGYITNGDFECGTTTKWETNAANVFQVVEGAGVDGSNAGYIEYNCDWGNIYQYVKVEKNTDYVYSFKAKADAGFQMILSVQGNDWATSLAKATQDCTGEWVEYSVEFNSGNFSDIIVYVQSNHTADAGHKVYVDDITIVEKTDVPPVIEESYDGHIYNGDFESGVLGDNWVLSSAGTSGISADAAKDGQYGFLISGTAWEEILTSMGFDVEAGVTYTVTFDAKTLKSGGRMNFQVKSPSNPAKPGAGNSVVGEYIDLTTNWKTYSYEFTQGANPYGSLLFVSQGSDFYIDNIKVTNDKQPGGDEPEEPAAGFVNGDFETGDASGWETWQSTTISEEASYGGNYGANLIGNGGWGGMLNQTIDVVAGKEYKLSFMLKVNATGVNVQVKQDSNSGASIPETGGWYDVNKAGEWTKIEYTFVAPTDKVFVNFCGGGNGKAEDVYVDDFVLIDPNAGTEPAVDFVNGDFETGDKSGWETWQSTVISEEASYGGNYGANLIGDGGWGGMLNQTLTGLTVGNTYVMSFMIKANSAGVNVQVKENNSGGNSIEGCGGYYDTNKVGEWTKIEYTFVATTADVFVNFCGSGTNKAENVYVDDFKLVGPNAGSEPSDNPVLNGDFETGDLSNWINLYDSCTVEFVQPGYDNSKYAVKVTTNGPWQQVRQNKIPVEPNTDYVVELYYRNADGMGVVIKEGNDYFDLTAFEVGEIPTDLTNTWKKHVFEFNTGKNKDGESIDPIDSICLLLIAPEGDCSAEFDNIRLIKKSEYEPEENDGPIANPGFETGDLTGWTNLWGSCEVDFESPGHNKSKYAMNFKGAGAWNQVRQDGIPVVPNTDYTLIAYVKNPTNINLVVKTGNDSANMADYHVPDDTTSAWIRHEISFNSGAETEVCVLVISNENGNGTALVDNIQIYKKGEEPEPPAPEVPVVPMKLLSYGVVNNRPMTADKNLITNGSFESNDGWSSSFLGKTLSIVDDETTRFGNKSLFFNTTGVEETEKHVFYVDVEPETDYVFSAWIKGAYISDDNRFDATIGVVNPDNNKYLTINDFVFVTNKRQLVPTAWDNEWHLRSVSFNTGSSTKVGIALLGSYTQMWVDDLALFKVEDGKKYVSENMGGDITPTFGETEFNGCDDDKCLIPDPTFTKGDSSDFWTTGTGWATGFMSFAESNIEYGNSLKYTATEKHQGHYFTKWVDVEPQTDYIFAVDVKILESGAGKLSLLDGKMRHNVSFLDVDFDQESYGADWFTMIVSFNTDVFDTLGIAVVDLGGSALIDNIRLFKAEDGKVVEDDFVARPDGWYNEGGQWVYFENGYKVTNTWKKDSKGWCYLNEDGYMATDKWIMDSVGWCYVGADGYCVTNKWVADSHGWCYLDGSGRMVTNKWVMDSVGWCYVGADGYCVTNKWVADSKGWCYLDGSGRMVTNKWVMDSVGWCYVGADGYCVTNTWVADSYGWCYLDGNGRMVTNEWVKDSKGWCYIGEDGYCATNSWVYDSKGLCYVDANGRMVYNTWVDGYYVNADGYYVG
ncbi:MAG: carbohydrate binding domain-containing protein [Clostridia bacterium]|nr:carbohydrate binding domain-containing protein [Clostridia bacterium]